MLGLVSGNVFAGSYQAVWNGLNNTGQNVASGRYIVKMSAPGFSDTITMTPDKKISTEIYHNGEYWIEAKIMVNGNTTDAFNTIEINSISEKADRLELINIPEKQIIIIISIIVIVGIIGLLIRK